MRTVRLRLHVPRKSASDVYATLADFERYPLLCEAVQNVTVTDVSEHLTVSHWEVTFRAGLLRWTEEDILDEVLFSATLDMGIPSLADALEPIAARTLIANIVSIVRGLVGSAELVASDMEVTVGSAS